jgi:hypothetical protein
MELVQPESRINRAPWHFCGERDTRPWDSGKQYLIVKPEVLEPSGHPAAVPSLVQIRPRSFQSYAPFKPFTTRSPDPMPLLQVHPSRVCWPSKLHVTDFLLNPPLAQWFMFWGFLSTKQHLAEASVLRCRILWRLSLLCDRWLGFCLGLGRKGCRAHLSSASCICCRVWLDDTQTWFCP